MGYIYNLHHISGSIAFSATLESDLNLSGDVYHVWVVRVHAGPFDQCKRQHLAKEILRQISERLGMANGTYSFDFR